MRKSIGIKGILLALCLTGILAGQTAFAAETGNETQTEAEVTPASETTPSSEETPAPVVTEAPKKQHKTTYKGKNYSRVYDYDYYTTKTKPSLAGKSDLKVLMHFVKEGIPKRARGNEAFDVKSYYNQMPLLRWKYGRKWEKYYRYYQLKGYKKGAVKKCKKLQDPINWYVKDGKKISLKKIYDFEYFTKNNSSAYTYWKNKDDAGAIRYFVETGLKNGMQGNEKYDAKSSTYLKYVRKFYPNYSRTAYYYAQNYSSGTKWLIVINQGDHKVSVFNGSKGSWILAREIPCSIGKPSTPTVSGVFTTSEKGLYFVSDSSRCWYYTRFYHGYMLHSVLYWNSSPSVIQAGTLGGNVSHGCVRLPYNDAKWIYDNIPLGTTVVSYNAPY